MQLKQIEQKFLKRDTSSSSSSSSSSVAIDACKSRPVSFYDNLRVGAHGAMDIGPEVEPASIASSISLENLSRERTSGAANGRYNRTNSNRVSGAVSARNVSEQIHDTIGSRFVTGAVSTGDISTATGWTRHYSANNADGVQHKKGQVQTYSRAPSMANCLSTTVPLNLAASQIAGRHTPTRNSLRHSRIIVMHRTNNATDGAFATQISQKNSTPVVWRHARSARILAGVKTILGIAVTSLALWLSQWAPNQPFTDNPCWSGIPLLLSGSFGVCLLCHCCFKNEYTKINTATTTSTRAVVSGYCPNCIKMLSVFLAVITSITCVVACSATIWHLTVLDDLECTPSVFNDAPSTKNATCACRFRSQLASPSEPVLRYLDLNCFEVKGPLTILLILSSACNVFGAIIAALYSYRLTMMLVLLRHRRMIGNHRFRCHDYASSSSPMHEYAEIGSAKLLER